MRIEQLYYFQEIAQTRSISLAAKNLYLSQQSLSAALAALEQEFHLQLFVRSRKGVTLTEKGEAFLQDAQYVIDAEQQHFQGPQNDSVAIPLKEPLSIEIALFTANERPLSQAAENFRQLLLHLSKIEKISNGYHQKRK